jgi:glutathione S-transferase
LVMEELGIPYEIKTIKFDDVKKKPFTDINPNGRCPGT